MVAVAVVVVVFVVVDVDVAGVEHAAKLRIANSSHRFMIDPFTRVAYEALSV